MLCNPRFQKVWRAIEAHDNVPGLEFVGESSILDQNEEPHGHGADIRVV